MKRPQAHHLGVHPIGYHPQFDARLAAVSALVQCRHAFISGVVKRIVIVECCSRGRSRGHNCVHGTDDKTPFEELVSWRLSFPAVGILDLLLLSPNQLIRIRSGEMKMKIKVAAVQAESIFGDEEWRNVDRAIRYLDEISELHVDLVCFPEGYPGPAHGPMDSKGMLSAHPIDLLREKIRDVGIFCACSDVVEHEELTNVYYLCQKLIGPDGEILADHRRCQPDEPELNEYLFGGKRHFAPGDGPTVVETEIGVIGLLICSELWVPELSRIAMLQGAEILISPVNGLHTPSLHHSQAYSTPLWETWKCISRCRAAENVQYVIVTQNAFDPNYPGVGHIAGPEAMLVEHEGVGVFTAELDMDRLRYLRGTLYEYEMLDRTSVKMERPVLCTRPGQQRLRRPSIYGKLLDESPYDFDYDYYLKEIEMGRDLETVAGTQSG